MATARRRHRAHASEESYFVSMTDLMIGLLFLFIIMLMAFAMTYRQAESDSDVKREELELERREQEERAAALQIERDRLIDNKNTLDYIIQVMASELRRHGIQVVIIPDQGMRLPESVLFDSGQAVLTAQGRAAIGHLAGALQLILPCFATLSAGVETSYRCPENRHGRLEAILIEGHTDNVPIRGGRFADNWDLSAARAIATYKELATAWGAVEEALNPSGARLIGVSGYGEHRPVAGNDTEEGRRQNRRIDLRILMATPGERPPP